MKSQRSIVAAPGDLGMFKGKRMILVYFHLLWPQRLRLTLPSPPLRWEKVRT